MNDHDDSGVVPHPRLAEIASRADRLEEENKALKEDNRDLAGLIRHYQRRLGIAPDVPTEYVMSWHADFPWPIQVTIDGMVARFTIPVIRGGSPEEDYQRAVADLRRIRGEIPA